MAEETENKTDAATTGPGSNGSTSTKDRTGHTTPDDAKPSASATGPDSGSSNNNASSPANPARGIIIGVIAGAALIAGVTWGVGYISYSGSHASTDDAYVTGDLVNVSPIVSGTVSQILVSEGDTVKRGQLVARLDDSGPLALLRQDQAAYNAAESQVPEAQIQLQYQIEQTAAAIRKAQAGVASQQAKTSGAAAQVGLTRATYAGQVSQAQSQLTAASAQAQQVAAQQSTAEDAVGNAQQAVTTARHAAEAMRAQISSASANATKAQNDLKRYAALLKVDAVTQQQYDSISATAAAAESELTVAQQQYAQSRSQVVQALTNVRQVEAQANAAQKASDAALQQVSVARAGLGLAQAGAGQLGIQQANLSGNQENNAQSLADLQNAESQKSQVMLRKRQIDTAIAQAAQQKAVLDNAKILLADTYIYAPADGEVVHKAVNVGTSASQGQTLFTMTQGNYKWVTANFKETQLLKVRPGETAEVEVDAFPGKIFKGVVKSINQATGSSTALLPPDNATGNFTKVVQRIPVRIELVAASSSDPNQYARREDITRLSDGESVTATIKTSH